MTNPTLFEHLTGPFLGTVVERKGLFSKRVVVPRFSAMFAGLSVFTQAAVLGRARNHQRGSLAQFFAAPGVETEACNVLIESTKSIVDGYGREPASFVEFFGGSIARQPEFKLPQTGGFVWRTDKTEVRLGQVLNWMDWFGTYGIGFGVVYPELVEKMWRADNEDDSWERYRQAGLLIPEQDKRLTLEEMEQMVLSQVAEYAREHAPQVLEPLGLTPEGATLAHDERMISETWETVAHVNSRLHWGISPQFFLSLLNEFNGLEWVFEATRDKMTVADLEQLFLRIADWPGLPQENKVMSHFALLASIEGSIPPAEWLSHLRGPLGNEYVDVIQSK